MQLSRYKESRMLVRRLCRLPGEDHTEFKRKISILRKHFEQFNVDVSELCQWLMGIHRKYTSDDNPSSFGLFGDFILEPSIDNINADETERDRWRLAVFDHVAGFSELNTQFHQMLPEPLFNAINDVIHSCKTTTTIKLFSRMYNLNKAHRLVLLKAAAEWIVARYQRGVENWQRQHFEWEKEKKDWQNSHKSLTEEICTKYTNVFKELKDTGSDGFIGVRRKRPRVCPYERMRGNKDNCIYAGEKGHGPLCWKFVDFVRSQEKSSKKINLEHFVSNAEIYLGFRVRNINKSNALNSLFRKVPQCKFWFNTVWNEYLKSLNLNEDTLIKHGRIPHCTKIGGIWEKSQCEWNPHTELCKQYKNKLATFDDSTLKLEPDYREWRRNYLAGPRKPSFRYPSSRNLPMPKIFGKSFHEIDFDNSVLRLKLDNMAEGEFLEFGFTPWPRAYRPSKKEVNVTSVHINFVGSRARAGLRFEVPHKKSRFTCTQDELNELRSRKFPRQAQDQQFLNAARQRLLDTFSGNCHDELRLLAVDLGEKGAHATVYQGRKHRKDVPLCIIKIDKLYTSIPVTKLNLSPELIDKEKNRGLRKEHVGRHLASLSKGMAQIAEYRQKNHTTQSIITENDFRGLKQHTSWMIRDWVRLNTSQIVIAAEENGCDLIVFESMRGFLPPGYDQLNENNVQKKRWLAMFAFGRIRNKVTQKAVERGMRIVTVPYFLSSQFCSECGHEQKIKKRLYNNKKDRKFECECKTNGKTKCQCEVKLDSDANAARVLARVFWGEIILPTKLTG